MGEPTCLVRSFSHPSSASRESKEGDPFRALTESISFGRFMTESLDWEKWSTFSHNRYLEEVEQFSKPGSVAQKKAFFEAHYKKRAAMKAAANSIPEEEIAVNNVPEPEISVNSIPEEEIAVNSVPEISVSSIPEEEITASNTPETDELLGDSLSIEASREMIVKEVIEEKEEEVENLIQVEVELDNVGNYDTTGVSPGEKLRNEEATEKENVALQKDTVPLAINKRHMSSLSKSSSQSRASKIPKSSTKMASSKPNSKSLTGDLLNTKKLTSKSVHMSINLSCHSGLTSKSSVKMSKDSSTAPNNSARASIHGTSKVLPLVSCQSDDKRNRSLVNKSVSGGSIAGGILQALSRDRTKSNGSKARSPIISSPFSFRSEERAAKRKEFFQKIEEKNITKTQTQVKSKVPLTQPRSPRLGRKPSNGVRETGSQLPQRPLVNPDRIVPKSNQSKQSTTWSGASLPRKKAHENASPNIQH